MTETVSFGYSEVTPEEKTAKVGEVFARVARRYDIMNDAMSGGMHRLWKNRFVARVKPRPGEHILDMAGGTGDIAFRMKAKGADVTVSDINPAMLEVGQERAAKRGLTDLSWSVQNAEALSFGSAEFDAYTIAFGIRNVTHIDRALSEADHGRTGRDPFRLEDLMCILQSPPCTAWRGGSPEGEGQCSVRGISRHHVCDALIPFFALPAGWIG